MEGNGGQYGNFGSNGNSIMLSNEDKYLVDDSGNYLFVGPFNAPSFLYYYGMVSGGTRPITITFGDLTEVDDPFYELSDPLTMTFEEVVGWAVFAEPVAAVTRTRWEAGLNNTGDIGGVPTRKGNLWPDFQLQEYGGAWYKVYISNYRTKFFVPVTVT